MLVANSSQRANPALNHTVSEMTQVKELETYSCVYFLGPLKLEFIFFSYLFLDSAMLGERGIVKGSSFAQRRPYLGGRRSGSVLSAVVVERIKMAWNALFQYLALEIEGSAQFYSAREMRT